MQGMSGSRRRRNRIVLAIGVAWLTVGSGAAGAAQPGVAQCGVVGYGLRVAPTEWDVGCSGGSPAATELSWVQWGSSSAVGTGLIRQRFDTTGDYEDQIYPTFPGRVTLSRVRGTTCRGGAPQYTKAVIEWTIPDGFEYDTSGNHSATFSDIGTPCPTYLLGSSSDPDIYGYGSVRPKSIWLGDASTSYFRLRWRQWGRSVARATGKTYPASGSYRTTVRGRVVASRPRKCGDMRYVYTRVTTYKAGSSRGIASTFSCNA